MDKASIADRLPFLQRRQYIIKAIRAFFDARGYLEVDTPYMVATPGEEVHLTPFSTLYKTPQGEEKRFFFHTSPEFAMKRIVAAIQRPIYQLARVWRNREGGPTHLPEFTMLEWYRPYCDLQGLMDETENLLRVILPPIVEHQKGRIDISQPFERLTLQQAFERYVGIDLLETGDDAVQLSKAANYSLRPYETWEDLFFRILLEKIEPYIGLERPTFLTHWPVSQAALARRDPKDLRVALRFELYAAGLELCNAFEELTDPKEQRSRFIEDRKQRKKLYPEAEEWPMDEELLEALHTMPPCSGIAMGLDRVVMLATRARHIEDILWI